MKKQEETMHIIQIMTPDRRAIERAIFRSGAKISDYKVMSLEEWVPLYTLIEEDEK